MKTLPYYIVFEIPVLAVLGIALGGWWTFLPVALIWILIPTLDALMGLDLSNPPTESDRRHSFAHEIVLWLWIPAHLAVLLWVLDLVRRGALSGVELAGCTASLGLLGGGGAINVAHEFMHRPGRLHRATAEFLMTLVNYPHFCLEHVHGHHRNVATPRDPASARMGENVYAFYARSVTGTLRSAWRIESKRVERAGGAQGLSDRRLRYPLDLLAAYALVLGLFGWPALAVFAAQGLLAFSKLEVINFVEHYGLRRRELAPGVFERVSPRHSWNSAHRLTNWYLFNLPRHADHHYLASRPYWSLRNLEGSPELPAGYATMFLVALVPPLWKRIMDPRVRAQMEEPALAA